MSMSCHERKYRSLSENGYRTNLDNIVDKVVEFSFMKVFRNSKIPCKKYDTGPNEREIHFDERLGILKFYVECTELYEVLSILYTYPVDFDKENGYEEKKFSFTCKDDLVSIRSVALAVSSRNSLLKKKINDEKKAEKKRISDERFEKASEELKKVVEESKACDEVFENALVELEKVVLEGTIEDIVPDNTTEDIIPENTTEEIITEGTIEECIPEKEVEVKTKKIIKKKSREELRKEGVKRRKESKKVKKDSVISIVSESSSVDQTSLELPKKLSANEVECKPENVVTTLSEYNSIDGLLKNVTKFGKSRKSNVSISSDGIPMMVFSDKDAIELLSHMVNYATYCIKKLLEDGEPVDFEKGSDAFVLKVLLNATTFLKSKDSGIIRTVSSKGLDDKIYTFIKKCRSRYYGRMMEEYSSTEYEDRLVIRKAIRKFAEEFRDTLVHHGFDVRFRWSKSTDSLYILLDGGMVKGLRVSDHRAKSNRVGREVILFCDGEKEHTRNIDEVPIHTYEVHKTDYRKFMDRLLADSISERGLYVKMYGNSYEKTVNKRLLNREYGSYSLKLSNN